MLTKPSSLSFPFSTIFSLFALATCRFVRVVSKCCDVRLTGGKDLCSDGGFSGGVAKGCVAVHPANQRCLIALLPWSCCWSLMNLLFSLFMLGCAAFICPEVANRDYRIEFLQVKFRNLNDGLVFFESPVQAVTEGTPVQSGMFYYDLGANFLKLGSVGVS